MIRRTLYAIAPVAALALLLAVAGCSALTQSSSADSLPQSIDIVQASFPNNGVAQTAQPSEQAEEEDWEEMHQACERGDYEAMAEWHAQYHGEEGTMNGGMMRGGMH